MDVTRTRMAVEIWSDVACPFCYVAKHQFAAALERFGARDDLDVTYKSYELIPGLRTEPTLRLEAYLAREKGIDAATFARMNTRVAEMGAEVGIEFRFDLVRVANTFRAHRLLHAARAAGEPGAQDELKERLLRACFAEGANVDDVGTLVALGASIGLDGTRLRAELESNAWEDEVRRDIGEARELGIRGVPFFLFDQKYAVSGAQGAALLLESLEQAHREWAARTPATSEGAES